MSIEVVTNVDLEQLSQDEGTELFARRCHELLGIGAHEFLSRFDAGEAWADGDLEAVTELAILIPFAR